MAKKFSESNGMPGPSHEAVARRAYEIWQSEGCPDGRAMEHWLRAVSELKAAESEERAPADVQPPRMPRRITAPARAEKRF